MKEVLEYKRTRIEERRYHEDLCALGAVVESTRGSREVLQIQDRVSFREN